MPVHFDIGIPLAISQMFSTMSEILTVIKILILIVIKNLLCINFKINEEDRIMFSWQSPCLVCTKSWDCH